MPMSPSLPVHVINLPKRVDRRRNIVKEFKDREEFHLEFITPVKNSVPAFSLWLTIKQIVIARLTNDFIIICEDDHQFTDSYTQNGLFEAIEQADRLQADILCGGVSAVGSSVKVTDHLYWMEKFTGLQFTIIFKRFYEKVLSFEFALGQDADLVISDLTENKFVLYPFISTQKEFGYSDVTTKNAANGHVASLFLKSEHRLRITDSIKKHFDNAKNKEGDNIHILNKIFIPTYVLCDQWFSYDDSNIKNEFHKRTEFDVRTVQMVRRKNKLLSNWLTIRKIAALAIASEDDVFIICGLNHKFTKAYKKNTFLRNVLSAHMQGADLLVGNTVNYGIAVALDEGRFWIDSFDNSLFIVVFKKLFLEIIKTPFSKKMEDNLLSYIAPNKMLCYPFISRKQQAVADIYKTGDSNYKLNMPYRQSMKRLKKHQQRFV